MADKLYEGDPCPDCGAPLELELPYDCSCHLSPPCPAHLDAVLICAECDWRADADDQCDGYDEAWDALWRLYDETHDHAERTSDSKSGGPL